MGDERKSSNDHVKVGTPESSQGLLEILLSTITRFSPRRVQGKLDLLLIVVIIPVLLVQGVIYYERFQVQRDHELQYNLEMGRGFASIIDGYIRDVLHQELAIGLAFSSHDGVTMPPNQMNSLLVMNVSEDPAVRHFMWVSPEGKVVAVDEPRMVGVDVSEQPYYQAIISGKEWVVSDLYKTRVTDDPTIAIARGLRDQNGILRGVVVAAVDSDRLGEVLQITRADRGGIFIVDTKGQLVYRYPEIPLTWDQRQVVGRTVGFERALQGEEMVGTFPAAVGDPVVRMAARVPIRSIGWVVGASRPEAQVMGPVIADTLRDFGIILAVAVIALIVAFAVGHNITVPIKHLKEQAIAIGSGDYGHRALATGAIELEELGDALNRMADEIRTRVDHRRFLAEAGNVLASSLDYETTLSTVARLAVPVLCDICVVEIVEDGELRPVAVACVDPSKEELLREMNRRFPPDANSAHPTRLAFLTGQSQVVNDIPDTMRSALTRESGELQMVRTMATRSAMAVPLKLRDEAIGVISLGSFDARRRYEPVDVALAEGLAVRASFAVDNARLYREAQKAIHTRDEFLSVAAHELKTPITSLRGFAQLMIRQLDKEGNLEPQRIRHALVVIDQQSKKLSRLVAQLLDISRIESGQLVLEKQLTDINNLVQGVVGVAQISASEHTILAHFSSEVKALVDPVRLEQVLTNLVDNAIKYSPAGGQIDVETSSQEETLRISVRDRGLGIPVEHRHRIFDRFYQGHGGGHNMGMGLGLYISRDIISLHHGRIEVEFPPDGGTRFVVILPTGLHGADAACKEDARL